MRPVTDVTEFSQPRGKAHLSPVRGLSDNEMVARSVAEHSNMARADEMMAMLEPGLAGPALLHSDQGWQHRQRAYRRGLASLGIGQSVSGKATRLDNACMEGFFGHTRDEFYRGGRFTSFASFKAEFDGHISYWNTRRYQAGLKGMTPVQYRGHSIRAA